VPDVLRRNAAQVWGEDGRAWLEALPDHLAACTRRFDLVAVGEPFELSFHWVAPARTASGDDVVLKLGVPGEQHLAREAAVLGRWDGRGAVRLVGHEPGHGALLLERARPGTPVADLVGEHDEEATRAVMQVARSLHAAGPDGLGLPDVVTEAASMQAHVALHGRHDPLPAGTVDQARELLLDLTRTRTSTVLLHGDLHHDNVLRGARQPWLAIDPHGVVGDPGYDVGSWMYNPDPDLRDERLQALVPRRIDQLADGLGMDRQRVAAWSFVKAVLSCVWSAQDGGRPGSRALDVAHVLSTRMP
jgi:streptomycin 6-kinase